MSYSVKPFAPKPFKRHSTIPNLNTFLRRTPSLASGAAQKTKQYHSTEIMALNEDNSLLSYATFESDLNNETAYDEIYSILSHNKPRADCRCEAEREVARSSNPFTKNIESSLSKGINPPQAGEGPINTKNGF